MNRIFRWTIGDCSDIGVSILDTAIKRAKILFSKYNFKFFVCLNTDLENQKIEKICIRNKVELIKSNWNNFPLPQDIIDSKGSFWKLCPCRLEKKSYEIVCDNDLVFQRVPIEIEEFLESDKNILTEEYIFHLGKYTKYFSKPYNSGLYGFPPGYDFEDNLILKWKETNSMSPLFSSRDEQGIVCLTLISSPFLEISKKKTCFVFDQGEPNKIFYKSVFENGFESKIVSEIIFNKSKLNKDMIHFLGSNRRNSHYYWKKYMNSKLL